MLSGIRTLLVFAGLAMLGACADNAAPHGANLATLNGLQSGTCGRTEQQLRCWGYVEFGGGTTPTQPPAPYRDLQVIRTGPYGFASCGLDGGGSLFCWQGGGENYTAVAPNLRFTEVTVGADHRCALGAGGIAYCWGEPAASGVGADNPAIVECGTSQFSYQCVREPTPVAGNERFTALSAGESATCGLTQGGEVLCWGYNGAGQLGGTDVDPALTPTPISSSDRFKALSAAAYQACAVTTAGAVLCWGTGSLGDGMEQSFVPVAATLPEGIAMKSVTVSASHSCALDTGSNAWCWGNSGTGTGSASNPLPGLVLGDLTFSTLAAGNGFTCGINSSGAWCWGDNSDGQLGNGGGPSSPIPVRVAGQDQFD
jgi:hypothetical protein